MSIPPAIFDRAARRTRRDRAARRGDAALEAYVSEALLERLESVTRQWARALVINSGSGMLARALRDLGAIVTETDHGPAYAARAGIIAADEDRLPLGQTIGNAAYDLVVTPAGLDTVDDLPGALIAARRALKPDGLFMGAMWGAPGLVALRQAVLAADEGTAVARLHPQIDVRGAGDLLARAGFAMPVADAETMQLSYLSLERLIDDLRAAGATNVLGARHPVDRAWLVRAARHFSALAGPDGRVTETASLLMLTGWAPAPGQPQPARRGSATTSLAAALERKP